MSLPTSRTSWSVRPLWRHLGSPARNSHLFLWLFVGSVSCWRIAPRLLPHPWRNTIKGPWLPGFDLFSLGSFLVQSLIKCDALCVLCWAEKRGQVSKKQSTYFKALKKGTNDEQTDSMPQGIRVDYQMLLQEIIQKIQVAESASDMVRILRIVSQCCPRNHCCSGNCSILIGHSVLLLV